MLTIVVALEYDAKGVPQVNAHLFDNLPAADKFIDAMREAKRLQYVANPDAFIAHAPVTVAVVASMKGLGPAQHVTVVQSDLS